MPSRPHRFYRRIDAMPMQCAKILEMPITVDQIDLWRQSLSEHQRVEFKEAKTQFDSRKLCEYCVAMANEGGGHLLLGVADKLPRTVVGTTAFPDTAGAARQLFEWLGFRVDVEFVVPPDGRVVVFHVPSRPRGTAYHDDGNYLMRAGDSLVPMSEDHLRRIFAEGEPDLLEEHAGQALDASQVVDLLDTQTFFELLKLPYPSDRQGVISRLLQERLIDADGGQYSIRIIGALLLAKRLDAFPDVARKAPRVVVYTGTSKLETKLSVRCQGMASTPLILRPLDIYHILIGKEERDKESNAYLCKITAWFVQRYGDEAVWDGVLSRDPIFFRGRMHLLEIVHNGVSERRGLPGYFPQAVRR